MVQIDSVSVEKTDSENVGLSFLHRSFPSKKRIFFYTFLTVFLVLKHILRL